MQDRARWLLLWAFFFMLAAAPVLYASDGDQVHFAQSISVGEDETAGSLVCIACSIRMEGSSDDIVAIGGSITLDGDAKGDVVAIGGAIHLGEDSSVAGDVTTIGGRLWRHPNSVVKGNITAQSGALILLGLVLGPLIPVILIIALVVWLLSRNRRPTPVRA